MKRNRIIGKMAILLCFMLLLFRVKASAASQKPSVRLDVRSPKQAILIIEDQQLTQISQDVVYEFMVENYRFSLQWSRENGVLGSLGYYEASDNSRVTLGAGYSDGSLSYLAKQLNDTTLEIKFDLSKEGLDIRNDESPRDLSEKISEIDFTAFTEAAELRVQYDDKKNDFQKEEYSYTYEEYYSKRMMGLTYVLELDSFGFDRNYDFGRCAGLSEQEVDLLYWTPQTDNYIITKYRTEHSFSYGKENYHGSADTYDLIWFDEKGILMGMHTLFAFEDESGYMANFRNVETCPSVGDNLDKCVGIIPEQEGETYRTFWIYDGEFIKQLRQNGATKERLLNDLASDTEIVENHSGEGRP